VEGSGFAPPAIQVAGAPPQEAETCGRVVHHAINFERGIGRDFRERCNRFYRQYRGFRQFRDTWTTIQPNDRDAVLYEAKKHWGAQLHIPLSFRTIESTVPAAIAHMPKLLVLPRDEQWRKNVEAVRLLIDAQQEQINIDLPFQAVMRSGRIYGLGVGKTYWRKETALRRRVQPRVFQKGFKVGKLMPEVVFDDPMFEDVDVMDFMWDPYGSDLRTCEWVIHRVWMSLEAVMARLQEGVWDTETAKGIDEERVRSAGGAGAGQRFDEVWQERMLASGFQTFHYSTRGEHPHEILEFHDGQRVLTVLDRQFLVQEAENPMVGMVPFVLYRPTPLQKQFIGIGDLEPLEHLQRELDTLRSQRRDAATIALCAGYAFDDAAIDEEDLTFGPASAIRVTNARPQDAIMPLPVRDVPGSGYEEEKVIREDMESVVGLQDAMSQAPGGQTNTATEAQLVQASLSRRIQLSARRFEVECVKPVAEGFLYLDQRHITENRAALRVPGENSSQEEAMETGAWKWFPIGPGELEGKFEIQPEGGSMAARNIPQDRADAALLMNQFAHSWFINPTKVLMRALELSGVRHPQAWLRDPETPVPRQMLKMLQLAGVDPAVVQHAYLAARTVAAPQEGPSSEQVTQMMGTNGNAPVPISGPVGR
jgi:hypothetical protein